MSEKIALTRQKRYGQFFSGNRVAELLVSLLPQEATIDYAIDPMAGSGDMLFALEKKGFGRKRKVGIEIDAELRKVWESYESDIEFIQGDAFSTKVPNAPVGWDLVITNPPYVRYQLLNENNSVDELPTAEQIRKNLLASIDLNYNLDNDEKHLYIELASRYSGLADMAVPSWILCASMVRQGGYLAMVVPETWLNREYAVPIYYLLLKCFDVESVVVDVNAKWFEDAQVKTCLVIARRKKMVSLEEVQKATTYYARLSSALSGKKTLVDNFQYKCERGIQAFSKVISEKVQIFTKHYRGNIENTIRMFPQIMESNYWRTQIKNDASYFMPLDIAKILPDDYMEYVTLEELGWKIGQGMRTGANDFFYGEVVSCAENSTVVTTNWYISNLTIDNQNLLHVLQNRSQVKGVLVLKDELDKRVIVISNQVRQEDLRVLSPDIANKVTVLNKETADYITAGEKYVPVGGKSLSPFPERSAVKTNCRKDGNGYRRFWYMLPDMTHRHLANLCLPRVCGKSIECLLVEQSKDYPIVIDANFTTLWNDDEKNQLATWVLLNSTWFKCYVECLATVMGGGALKVEASHVKQVRFPKYTNKQWNDLMLLGGELKKEGYVTNIMQMKIDNMVMKPFGSRADEVLDLLRKLFLASMNERGIVND